MSKTETTARDLRAELGELVRSMDANPAGTNRYASLALDVASDAVGADVLAVRDALAVVADSGWPSTPAIQRLAELIGTEEKPAKGRA